MTTTYSTEIDDDVLVARLSAPLEQFLQRYGMSDAEAKNAVEDFEQSFRESVQKSIEKGEFPGLSGSPSFVEHLEPALVLCEAKIPLKGAKA